MAFITLLTSGFAARTIHAYTQVNIATPFMYKNIDPIVFPGEYDKSHLHSFYGSDAVTVSTQTSEELRGGCTNAENPNDMSTYWTPTLLYQSGDSWEPVPVMRFSAYYGLGDEPASIPFPENLQMLAGDASAQTSDAMPAEAHSEWFCEGDANNGLDGNGFPTQTCSTHLQQLLYFPNCVNTETLEYAYKDGEPGSYHECPSGMQAMPQLRFSIRYDMREVVPGGWSGTAPVKLACGPAWCSHGDFINGWTEESGQALVDAASLKDEYLSVNGALGNDGDMMSCEATDADPEHGTGDYAESVEVMSKRSVPAVGWTSRNRLARSRRGM
ncbi:hypothetical protein LTR37_005839 [Vermiconidia calcicola]|uniref:Uncharacterized protein n=1 Tax=Vermiconidia calcicola TaxID=1690605 RepID=A0ACC3NJI6_9PEZI|nr:hypothetical protein LTR37_005839 [Vermiconidia calcicola]